MSLPVSDNAQIAHHNSAQSATTTQPTQSISIDLMTLMADSIVDWQVHRCQVTQALISQHQPMKVIYHYEHLPDVVKLQHPLSGQLLASFDALMTREQFAQRLGIKLQQVANPWQIKFVGKLVVFHAQPEIALRLHWVNTTKPFEPIYLASKLTDAAALQSVIDHAFSNWQFTAVEVIQKNPLVTLTYRSDAMNEGHTQATQSIVPTMQFVPVPNALVTTMLAYLHAHPTMATKWLAMIKAEAQSFVKNNHLLVG